MACGPVSLNFEQPFTARSFRFPPGDSLRVYGERVIRVLTRAGPRSIWTQATRSAEIEADMEIGYRGADLVEPGCIEVSADASGSTT